VDNVGSATYESLSGIAKTQYEQRFLAGVRYALVEEPGHSTPPDGEERWYRGILAYYGGELASVGIDGVGDETSVVVHFRMRDRPGQTFAMRRPIWPVRHPNTPYDEGLPEQYGGKVATNFDEEIATKWWDWKDRQPDRDGLVWCPSDAP
jgi:hypothetical protein